MDLYPEDIDVVAFVRDAAGTVEALVGRKANALDLDLDLAPDLDHARTDATKLRQCLFNPLSNAAKFAHRRSSNRSEVMPTFFGPESQSAM